jgi:Maf-like protein
MVLSYIPALSKCNVILASASPRRAELLQQIGLNFTIKPSNFEETLPKASFDSTVGYAIETARQKALDIARHNSAADLIISADTSETMRAGMPRRLRMTANRNDVIWDAQLWRLMEIFWKSHRTRQMLDTC